MILFLILVIFSFMLLVVEYWTIQRCVNKIPLRILVNGTRGKSTVTKYISAALRKTNKNTIAKITGVIPTIIFSDGSDKIIKRIGSPRINEQFKIIRLASKLSADCLILECMSIAPELQKLESKIFKPNIYVITNIRDDHREQMGNVENQVNAICNAIPSNSVVVTGEKKYLSEIKSAAESQNSSVIFSNDNAELKSINFPYGSFHSNMQIALSVCNSAKFETKKIEEAIIEILKRAEEFLFEFQFADKKVRFVNGFAVNDVTSAQEFLDYWENKLDGIQTLNIIFNSRSDRPLRTKSFAKWLGSIKNLNRVILTGNHVPRSKLELIRNGIEPKKIIIWARREIKNVVENLKMIAEPDSVFIGLGNIADEGLMILKSLGREYQTKSLNVN